jgi:pyrroline-5-carboxylate reductase
VTRTIAIIGTGRMGEALLAGLLRSGWIGSHRVTCADARADRMAEIQREYGVDVTTVNREAVSGRDIVVLAVKPKHVPGVLEEIGSELTSEQTLISVAAGVRIATIEAALGADVPVVRVMSNVAVQVDEAMSVIAPGTHADEDDLDIAEKLFGHVGDVLEMPEYHLDSVTALSGSGPAYFALVTESMIDAGVLLGLPREVASRLTIQTMVGSAKLLRDNGLHPALLREMVTSPGGTTASALRQFEQSGVRAAIIDAIEAARRRGNELAGDG